MSAQAQTVKRATSLSWQRAAAQADDLQLPRLLLPSEPDLHFERYYEEAKAIQKVRAIVEADAPNDPYAAAEVAMLLTDNYIRSKLCETGGRERRDPYFVAQAIKAEIARIVDRAHERENLLHGVFGKVMARATTKLMVANVTILVPQGVTLTQDDKALIEERLARLQGLEAADAEALDELDMALYKGRLRLKLSGRNRHVDIDPNSVRIADVSLMRQGGREFYRITRQVLRGAEAGALEFREEFEGDIAPEIARRLGDDVQEMADNLRRMEWRKVAELFAEERLRIAREREAEAQRLAEAERQRCRAQGGAEVDDAELGQFCPAAAFGGTMPQAQRLAA